MAVDLGRPVAPVALVALVFQGVLLLHGSGHRSKIVWIRDVVLAARSVRVKSVIESQFR